MPDELKKILSRELDEIKKNKIRFGAMVACFFVVLFFWIADDNSGDEEIILTEEPPLTKDLPVKVLPVEKSSDGVKIVLGANADALFIGDPFAVEKKEIPTPPPAEPSPPAEPPPPLPKIPAPSIIIQPPIKEKIEPPKDDFILMGTAISGENKTAMFLRGSETLFLTIGEEIGGRKISDITPELVTFEGGDCIYFQKELNR